MAGGAFDADTVGEALGRAPTGGTDVGDVVAATMVSGLNSHNSRLAATRGPGPQALFAAARSAAKGLTTCRYHSIAILGAQDNNSARTGAVAGDPGMAKADQKADGRQGRGKQATKRAAAA